MKEATNTCECIAKLMLIERILPYNRKQESYYFSKNIEEGTLCIVSNNVRDNGYYDANNWISNIEIETDYYPINYCPICGQKIEYKEVKTMKMIK